MLEPSVHEGSIRIKEDAYFFVRETMLFIVNLSDRIEIKFTQSLKYGGSQC